MSFDDQKKLHLLSDHCMADNPHTLMIQPDGSFCRCEHENINDNYGNIENGVTEPQKLEKWKDTTEPSVNCPKCAIYPACYHLRNCMNSDVPCIEEFQKSNLEKQRKRIRAMYIQKTEVKKDEGI
jgi:radical SAM protein with 4Fe4S-binding SPASM domain